MRGYDPAVRGVDGVEDFGDEAQAARGAGVVLSVNAAAAAVDAARVAAAELRSGQVFADLNAAAPALKREVAAVVEPTGAAFADVALHASGPRPGHPHAGARIRAPARTAFAQHAAAARHAASRTWAAEPGEAAARKLLRSVFMKGLAAAVEERRRRREAAGCEDWLREDVDRTLRARTRGSVDRLLEGSRKHAVRRTEEMAAASASARGAGRRAAHRPRGRGVAAHDSASSAAT